MDKINCFPTKPNFFIIGGVDINSSTDINSLTLNITDKDLTSEIVSFAVGPYSFKMINIEPRNVAWYLSENKFNLIKYVLNTNLKSRITFISKRFVFMGVSR